MQKICPETFSGPAERWGEAGWLRTSCHLHINGFFCLNSHSNRKILGNENGQHLCRCFPPNMKKKLFPLGWGNIDILCFEGLRQEQIICISITFLPELTTLTFSKNFPKLTGSFRNRRLFCKQARHQIIVKDDTLQRQQPFIFLLSTLRSVTKHYCKWLFFIILCACGG